MKIQNIKRELTLSKLSIKRAEDSSIVLNIYHIHTLAYISSVKALNI